MTLTRLFTLTFALLATASNAFADQLHVSDVNITPGETKEVAVELQNPVHSYIMLEFWMSLPDGVAIADDEYGDPACTPNDSRFARSHQLVVSREADNNYHFLIYSSRNETLKGSSGQLFTMTIQAAANCASGTGQGRIYSQLMADADKTEHHPADVTFGVTISDTSVNSTTQTLTLVKGWNWVSSPLQEPLPLEQLKENCSRIVGQEQELIRDPQFGMTGGFTTLEAGKAYKVLADEAVTLTFSGQLHDDTTARVELKKGWNWMAYPCGEAKSIAAAITNAEAGDRIVSQDGTTATYSGGSWTGTLTMLTPGQGYLYKSVGAKQLVFNF